MKLLRLSCACVLTAVLATGCGTGVIADANSGSSSSGDGCSMDVAPLTESLSYTKYEDRLTRSLDSVNPPLKLSTPSTQIQRMPWFRSSLDGRQLSGVLSSPAETALYYGGKGSLQSDAAFVGSGGLRLTIFSLPPGADLVGGLVDDSGDRVFESTVGSFPAAVSWADPDEAGNRPHHVVWQQGQTGFVLVSVVDGAHLLQVSRSLVCTE